jgi:hypothetical protein
MKKILGYFSAAFLAAFLALTAQFSLVSAQQSSGGHPTPECEACAQACRDAFDACKLERAGQKNGFGTCARDLEQCGAACRRPGGACNPQTDGGGR